MKVTKVCRVSMCVMWNILDLIQIFNQSVQEQLNFLGREDIEENAGDCSIVRRHIQWWCTHMAILSVRKSSLSWQVISA